IAQIRVIICSALTTSERQTHDGCGRRIFELHHHTPEYPSLCLLEVGAQSRRNYRKRQWLINPQQMTICAVAQSFLARMEIFSRIAAHLPPAYLCGDERVARLRFCS